MTCEEIAKIINGELVGSTNSQIINLNRIENAQPGEATFLSNPKFEKYIEHTGASCVIISNKSEATPRRENQAFIKVDNPYEGFVRLIKHIYDARPKKKSYIDHNSNIHENAMIAESAFIGPGCVIGAGSKIGENCILIANVTIYDNVIIGGNTFIHANAVLCDDSVVGKNCILHPGTVIGSDGFGYIEREDKSYDKIPQIGNVVIEDDVEIGANTTIDRAMVGSTIIEKGVKLDNLVHIAHNCIICENTAMAGQTGISGSTKVGKRNRFGGQVGLAGHMETADDVLIVAQSGVSKSINKSGVYFGSPIKEQKRAFKIEAALRNLPEIAREFEKLKKEVEELKKNK